MVEPSQQKATIGTSNESEVFTALHHLVSWIDADNRVDDVVEKARALDVKEAQLFVDCLSMALDRDAAPLKTRAYVWRSLIRVAASTKVFAQNHVLDAEHISPGNDPTSPDVHRISGCSSVQVKVMKKTENNTDALFTESLVSWAHLCHQNIVPLYAVFLEGEDSPSLVTLYITNGYIRNYIQKHPEASCLLLISDVVNGLSHIHQLGIVHGGLNPESVLISNDGRALITDLDTSESPPVRYSAPELLADEEIQATKAIDMWAFACLCYEVLSGAVPFCHITKEFKVAAAIAVGSKPNRPGQGGVGGKEIGDVIWQTMLMCWEFQPEGRPTCLTVHQIFLGVGVKDDRPMTTPTVLTRIPEGFAVDLEHAKASLTKVLGSDHSPSLRVPEHSRNLICTFVSDTVKLKAAAAAAKKLSPDDTQMLVDFLDLVVEDLSIDDREPIIVLLSSIITSTYIIPRCYKLTGIQYDLASISEGHNANAYKGRSPNTRISAVKNNVVLKNIFALLPDWYHASHPNVIPFYGVFHEDTSDSERFLVVTPSFANGNMEDYALALSQELRVLLISDVIKAIAYLHSLNIVFIYYEKEDVMVSDEGRAVLLNFSSSSLFTKDISSKRKLHFFAPNVSYFKEDDIWAFGCLCYKVLSRKLPYFQYTDDKEIRSAVSRGELPIRPNHTDNEMDKIDDQAWDLITKCCQFERADRPKVVEVVELIAGWVIEDNRPPAKSLPESNILAMRSRPNVDFHHVETLLSRIQVELLRSPLSKLLQNHIKDVAQATTGLTPDDTRTLVDFLDLALKEHLSISEEQNRVLALLSRITSSTHIFPGRYELKGIKYNPEPMAEGGYGTVHRGIDLNVCVKVMTQVDPKALTPWIRELILWAHSSHSNILPFCGVLLESVNNNPRICLVSPFMKNGNLHGYAPRLPQKSRLPLIIDVINGLQYIHGLGIVHSDLKGENVLISNEGRALITDFGSTQITTATVTATTSLVPTTLRFAAPEVVLTSGPPSKERDIWSFGCLCYEILSRLVPYYQYRQTVQVSAALARKELPKRPSSAERNVLDEADDGWDDFDEEDWDEIDDQAWNLITKCCAPEPEDRLKAPAIQELIVDMKIWDDRPTAKAILGTEISVLRVNPEIDLNRVGELLSKLHNTVVPAEEGEESFFDVFNSMLSDS